MSKGWFKVRLKLLALILTTFFIFSGLSATERSITIGSKNFGENFLLAEILALMLESEGLSVDRAFGLGGTLICYEALRNEEIDLYFEYTGTLSRAVLNLEEVVSEESLAEQLLTEGLFMMPRLGFNNTYAIAVRRETANLLKGKTIGALGGQEDLKVVFSHEFLERPDGWNGLSRRYGLSFSVSGIEHGLAYRALADGVIDVTDAYSTDGELERYDLVLLNDSLSFFPTYFAVPLVRASWASDKENASILRVIEKLSGEIDDATMRSLNAQVVSEGITYQRVARAFLLQKGFVADGVIEAEKESVLRDMLSDLGRNLIRHLELTGLALFFGTFFGLAISLFAYDKAGISKIVLSLCGLLQTIPSLALLAIMIPIFGIGFLPAVIALFLYSLLPIVRNTLTALTTIDPVLISVSDALGMTKWQQLRLVKLPLSAPAIFAGIRTAAVISIGTATLAAFIGAGGLGDPIVVGLSLSNVNLILQGAIPAALLALLTEYCFGKAESAVSSRYRKVS